MWILKLSGFSLSSLVFFFFFFCFVLSLFDIVSDLALNQPTQSDCLDFVLCILFSHTPLFLLLLKVVFHQNELFLFVMLQKLTYFLKLKMFLFFFIWAFSTCCRCVKMISCDLFDTGLGIYKMYFSITGSAVWWCWAVYYCFPILGTKQEVSFNHRKIIKSLPFYFFAK